MMDEVSVTTEGNVQLPLPFKHGMLILPDNSTAVYGRTKSPLGQLSKHEWKVSQCIESMQRNISQGYVEQVLESYPPPVPGAVWYIPIFCVTHPKKAKIRLVFDASAQYLGVSLNDKFIRDLTLLIAFVAFYFASESNL